MSQRARDYQPGGRVPGTVYEVVRLIGAGGMGTVYDVEDTTIGKRYVLKTLHPQLGAREDLARRMQNEARTLARLNHSNIVEVITAGVTGDDLRLPYYVMERLNGQSLRVVLEKKGQLELPHAYHIGIDLLDALDHAHDKGVIHRDVKPDNIFLHRTSAGVTVTKLLDFGILSLLDATARETAGRFLGTLRYSAPEQLRGEKPTAKVDVYAAGLVLYEMIAGRGPFDGEADPQAIGAAHMEKAPPPLSLHVPVPIELDALVMAALAKAPEDRPRDAFSFAAGLRELKRSLPGWHARESTEERATAAAVIGPESAAQYVAVRRPSPEGAYVISPVRELSSGQTSLPATTLRGITAPPVGPSLANPMASAQTATTPEAVDRLGPTGSYVPDTVASPRHGTEALPLDGPSAPQHSVPPLATSIVSPGMSAGSPFQWPAERESATSEEPHVQTLSFASPRSSRWAARMVGVAAVLGIMTIVGARVVARHASWWNRGVERASAATKAASTPPVQTVVSVTAPAVAPSEPEALGVKSTSLNLAAPGADARAMGPDRAAATVATAESATPRSRPAPALTPARSKPQSTAAKPPPSPPRTDRPGPGF